MAGAMRLPGYHENFLETLDVARTGSKIGTPEWSAAYRRLKQFQSAWRRTQVRYTIWSILIAILSAFGLSTFLERAGVLGGEIVSIVYVSAIVTALGVSNRLAQISFETVTGIDQKDMHTAEVILDRFKREVSDTA